MRHGEVGKAATMRGASLVTVLFIRPPAAREARRRRPAAYRVGINRLTRRHAAEIWLAQYLPPPLILPLTSPRDGGEYFMRRIEGR